MANNLIEISIREVKHSLTKAEKAIAEYIEPRLDSIVKLSLKELAEKKYITVSGRISRKYFYERVRL